MTEDLKAAATAYDQKYSAATNTLCGLSVALESPGFECAACSCEWFIPIRDVRGGRRVECLECGAGVDVLGGESA